MKMIMQQPKYPSNKFKNSLLNFNLTHRVVNYNEFYLNFKRCRPTVIIICFNMYKCNIYIQGGVIHVSKAEYHAAFVYKPNAGVGGIWKLK